MIWYNLKPETTSVLFGYNNFWQLSANLDYFTRYINSPFIHFWYLSILLQFDIVFPFIYVIFRKLGDKIHRIIPCIVTLLFAIIGSVYFYQMSLTKSMMITYYDTFSRVFSLLFGLSLGFFHSYYGSLIPKILKGKIISKILFWLYIFVLTILFIFIDANSSYYAFGMILVTLISCRLIDYGTIGSKNGLSIFDRFIKSISNVSYEIYLFQYPVIFFFQYFINMNFYFKLFSMIVLILLLSYFLHFCCNFHKSTNKLSILRYFLWILIGSITLYGVYQYYKMEDYSIQMKELEQQLTKNEKIMQEKQAEYALQMQQENDDWLATLHDFENYENDLKNVVNQLPVVGIGDSVMLGAIDNLYQEFPNGYFDAKISRTAWVANDILLSLKNSNRLGNPIVINLGANGDCPLSCKVEMMKKCEDCDVFWLNVTNDSDVHVNDNLLSFASSYDNLHIIDWNSISNGHSEYFVADGIHLTEIGKEVYTRSIYDAIYQVYFEKYQVKKEEIIKTHEEDVKSKISFYGNDILLNIFDEIHTNFKNSQFMIRQKFDYEMLKKEIETSIQMNSLTNQLVFAFDNMSSISLSEYQSLIDLCKEQHIYILAINDSISSLARENVTILNFYPEIINHPEYLMIDGIHLTEEGNKALYLFLFQEIAKK